MTPLAASNRSRIFARSEAPYADKEETANATAQAIPTKRLMFYLSI
jgi:hypothetical protein